MNLRDPIDLLTLLALGVMCAAVPALTFIAVAIIFANVLDRAVTK